MNDFEQPGSLAPTGLFHGGTKYMVIQGEPGAVIRGKKVMTQQILVFLLETISILILYLTRKVKLLVVSGFLIDGKELKYHQTHDTRKAIVPWFYYLWNDFVVD